LATITVPGCATITADSGRATGPTVSAGAVGARAPGLATIPAGAAASTPSARAASSPVPANGSNNE
jgi:hypothetical protein